MTPVSAAPTAGPSHPVGGAFRRDSFVEVATNDLRVRTQPRVSDDSIRLEPLLWEGAELYVMDGPVAASGFDWYLVKPMHEFDVQVHPDPPEFGWVAAGKDGEAWLRESPVNLRCDQGPLEPLRFEIVHPPVGLRGLACFGARVLTFRALLGRADIACGADPPWLIEPAWLGHVCGTLPYTLREPGDGASPSPSLSGLEVAVDAAIIATLPPLTRGQQIPVDVVGQFDHPAAQTCQAVPGSGSTTTPKPAPEVVVLECRSEFALTAIRLR